MSFLAGVSRASISVASRTIAPMMRPPSARSISVGLRACQSLLQRPQPERIWPVPVTSGFSKIPIADKSLRGVCGRERRTRVPSEATFSRAFGEFAQGDLPDMHAASARKRPGCRFGELAGVLRRLTLQARWFWLWPFLTFARTSALRGSRPAGGGALAGGGPEAIDKSTGGGNAEHRLGDEGARQAAAILRRPARSYRLRSRGCSHREW